MKSRLFLSFIIIFFSLNTLAESDPKAPDVVVDPGGRAALQALAGFMPGTPRTPEQMRENMIRSVEMQNEMTRLRVLSFSNPEMATAFAQFSRAYYEALVAAGFSKNEALKIVVNVGLPNFH